MRLTLSSLHLPKGLNGEQYFHIERIQGREYINQLFEYHVIVYVTDELGHPVHGYEGLEGYVSKQQSQDAGVSPGSHLNMQALLGQELSICHEIGGIYAPEQHPLFNTSLAYPTDELQHTQYQHQRYYRGFISRIEQLSTHNRYSRYQLTLVPWTWFMSQRSRYAIYQYQTVVDILQQVFNDYPYAIDYRLVQDYPSLSYQVQYNESDYHFVHRLMQEHGINYHFEHGHEQLTLVLSDSNAHYQVHPHRAYQHLMLYPPHQRFPDAQQYLEHFESYQQLYHRKHHLQDYHFKQPSQLIVTENIQEQGHGLQHLHHLHWSQGDHRDESQGQSKVQQQAQSHEQYQQRALAHGSLQGLQTGFSYRLHRHPNEDLNQDWIVIGLETYIQDISQEQRLGQHFSTDVRFVSQAQHSPIRPEPYYQVSGASPYPDDREVLSSRFAVEGVSSDSALNQLYQAMQVTQVTQPASTSSVIELDKMQQLKQLYELGSVAKHHPRFTSYYIDVLHRSCLEKPIARPQTATVVGPDGEEIYTDEYGRVKVKFHWDKYNQELSQRYPQMMNVSAHNQRDPNLNTCWLRVSTGWAGEHYGSIHIPRVGHEVIVDFINGDPDMPFISGRLHNAEQVLLWELPMQSSLSGFKSKEYKGSGYNQLVMDDSTGKVQTQLKSSHQSSELNLGHISRIEERVGRGREEHRGEGFELRTDGHGVVRADKGLILTSYGRKNAQHHMTHLEETIELMGAAQKQQQSYVQSMIDYMAENRSMLDTAYPSIDTDYRTLKGSESKKELSVPHLLLSSANSLLQLAKKNIHQYSQEHMTLSSGSDLNIATGKKLLASVAQGIGVLAHNVGIKLIAASGQIDISAQRDDINIIADEILRLISKRKKIELMAMEEIVLNVQGNYIRITPDKIEQGTKGAWEVYAQQHELTGPKIMDYSMPQDPYDEMYVLTDTEGNPIAGFKYKITTSDGMVYRGITNDKGEAMRIGTANIAKDFIFEEDDEE